jgi:uncharacterized membrane-anchored protein
MLVDIPSGEHLLELKFVDTPIRHYSKLVTIFALLAVIISIAAILIHKTTSRFFL